LREVDIRAAFYREGTLTEQTHFPNEARCHLTVEACPNHPNASIAHRTFLDGDLAAQREKPATLVEKRQNLGRATNGSSSI